MVARALVQMLGGSSLFLFEVKGFAEPLRVVRFSGMEGLSSLFEFKVELACESQDIDFAEVVGKPAQLILQGELTPRYLSGIVSRFEQINELPRYALYQATVVPLVWRLTQRYDCRIFQKLATPAILKKVFVAAGVPADRVRFVLDDERYEPRDYCVQYRESDWAFVSRLMEEDGIFYFFEHEADKHLLVMGDGAPALKPMDGGEVLPFRRETRMVVEEEHVSRFRLTEEVRSGRVALRDFKFKQPELLMEVQKQAEVDADLEVYDYPGEYQDPGQGSMAKGQTIARVRLEAWQATKRVGQGRSDCERLCPGRLFTLEEHSRRDYNTRYLIMSVRHHGSQPQVLGEESPGGEFSYSNRFTCIPAKVPYRPARVTPRPQVRGVQTAVVVGPPGEEIHVDEWGRVKVQFHWDRQGKKDEHSSCWVRVSQLWAGEVWGSMFIPRVGQEVLVDFIEGDPDRPIIIGRVYNAKNPTPYELPTLKTRSTLKSSSSPGGEGYNELRFEDDRGNEQLFMHAERNMDVHVKNDSFENILHDRHQTIGSQGKSGKVGDQNELLYRDKSLKVHRHSQEHIGGDLKLTVGGIDGEGHMDIVVKADRKELVHKDSHLHVKQDLNEQVDGKQSLTVGKELHLKVGQLTALESGKELHLKSTNVVIEAVSGVTIKGPGGFITIDASGIAIKGALVQINTGGSPLSGSGAEPTEPTDAVEATPIIPTRADSGHGRQVHTEGPKQDESPSHSVSTVPSTAPTSSAIRHGPFVLQGSEGFRKKTLSALNDIKKTPTGAKLIQSLERSGKIVTIKETNRVNKAIPTDEAKAKPGPDGKPGVGSDTTIYFNPNCVKTGNKPWMTRPPAIGLAHELIHADYSAQGNNDFTSRGENMAVGVPPYDKQPFTENKIRSEWTPRQPQRPHF